MRDDMPPGKVADVLDRPPEEAARVLRSLDAPDWGAEGLAGGWGSFVPDAVRRAWPGLSAEARVAAFAVAETASDRAAHRID